ncbi:hypothetical protein O1611_g6989 [Lasiodiplodia mahajangana]|uniref:Uncharacterized protein n=1 Tax=Lasiodiplodia mahajangana TaxID=1108764 RepID=A0ACC2JGP2_9PEZI|nr:hypothetical protein O1611_g6989 [Lasiodiplodia mahajangana]
MDKIPPEIVYVVCSLLEIDDVLSFRLVNKLFADIGAAYMLPEVTFYMHQEELDRLEAISLHPIFSKQVTSLNYYAEILVSPKVTWCEFLRNHKRNIRWNGTLREKPHQLVAEYKRYSDAVDGQDELMKKKKDIKLLKEILPRFPKLDTLRMSSGHWLYDEACRVRRKNPLSEFFKRSYMGDVYPEGKHQLDALLMANADSPCALTNLRAGPLHWSFFKRSERELFAMFKPLVNLTSIGLSVSVTLSDHDGAHDDSLFRKCRRALAKGNMRKILKSLPQLQCMFVEIEDLEPEEDGKGAFLGDIIEPGFRWANLKQLTLGGIATNRTELTNVLTLHKDTLRILCLRNIALGPTSWRKLLPVIRKHLHLEEACICGDICGELEEEGSQDPWVPHKEFFELSIPGMDSDCMMDEDDEWDMLPKRMRQSINMYCRQGGTKYPDELPLNEIVVGKYYEQYVKPFFEDEDDLGLDEHDANDGLGPNLSEGDSEGGWEDVSDEELGSNVSGVSISEAALFFHTMMANPFGPLAGMGLDDNDHESADVEVDVDSDLMDTNLGMGLLPFMMGPYAFGFAGRSDSESDDDMPELIGTILSTLHSHHQPANHPSRGLTIHLFLSTNFGINHRSIAADGVTAATATATATTTITTTTKVVTTTSAYAVLTTSRRKPSMASLAAGIVDPTKAGKYRVVLSDALMGKDPKELYTGIRYNHKPTLSSPTAPHQARIKPTDSTDPSTSYDLSFQDDGGRYAYQGTRGHEGNQYVLIFDPEKDVFVLHRVDSMFNMNLVRTPTNNDADDLRQEHTQLEAHQPSRTSKPASATTSSKLVKPKKSAPKEPKPPAAKKVEPPKPTLPAKPNKAHNDWEDESSDDDLLTIEDPGGAAPAPTRDFSPGFINKPRRFSEFVQQNGEEEDEEDDEDLGIEVEALNDADGEEEEEDDDDEPDNFKLPSPIHRQMMSQNINGSAGRNNHSTIIQSAPEEQVSDEDEIEMDDVEGGGASIAEDDMAMEGVDLEAELMAELGEGESDVSEEE